MRGKNVGIGSRRGLASAAVVGLLLGGAARDARADTANDVKGTLGGAMLGAEIVMLTESAFRLRPGWMYLAGGAGGALAGGYLGYRISDGSSNRPPSFLLAGGIALIIPTIMGVLTATQYEPIGSVRQDLPDEGSDDGESSDGSDGFDASDGSNDSQPGSGGGSSGDGSSGDGSSGEDPGASGPRDPSRAHEAGVRTRAGLRIDLPSIGLAQAFSRDELATFQVRQVTELHVSLLRGAF